jgi:nucleoside-diphosphate-sugar epimerase
LNILVTGGAGYLGSVLIPKLLIRGHRVRVLDVGYFGTRHLRSYFQDVHVIRDDLRRLLSEPRFGAELLESCDCVVHLAAISNDPSADLNPELTDEVNYRATLALAEQARSKSIRFLLSSSCSVYGEAEGELVETSPVNPLTTYAVSKVNAERGLQALSHPGWSPIILRNGTLFGYSPRMRFDLVVNIFSLYSTLYNEIKIFGEGQQWRPYLHVSDCARAFVHFVERPEYQYQCYNIAHQNLRVVDVAALFRQINPQLKVSHVDVPDQDSRDYRVATQRMGAEGFATQTDVRPGAEQLVEAIASGLIPDPESIYYRNAKWLGELTHLGDKSHREIVSLIETAAGVTLAAR